MFSGVLSLNTQFTESILSFNRIKFKREVLYELKEVYIYCWQLSQFDSINLEWPKIRDPSAEGTGRKGASYLDETLWPNQTWPN